MRGFSCRDRASGLTQAQKGQVCSSLLPDVLMFLPGDQFTGRGTWQAMAQMNPAISRAIATVTVVVGLPALLSLR